MEYFMRYMAVPGKIESINVVIDLKDLTISQIPIGVLREVHRSMGMYYVGRIFRFYICNMLGTWLESTFATKNCRMHSDYSLILIYDIQNYEEFFQCKE
ncbi:unnamed protein product [Durusdinium trenchii]|uniref:CRAL-TRIO domain-containing protein n=1 Tax=Durusdinium trenchii TaxID=1381693 RepID=A0ABP0SX36_9DINO